MVQKQFSPKLFHSLSLSRLVPEGHLVRRLEGILDLSFVRRLCRRYYSHTGQPSVDPVVVFKMLLLGYFYGITSERRLAEECSSAPCAERYRVYLPGQPCSPERCSRSKLDMSALNSDDGAHPAGGRIIGGRSLVGDPPDKQVPAEPPGRGRPVMAAPFIAQRWQIHRPNLGDLDSNLGHVTNPRRRGFGPCTHTH